MSAPRLPRLERRFLPVRWGARALVVEGARGRVCRAIRAGLTEEIAPEVLFDVRDKTPVPEGLPDWCSQTE